MSDEILSVWKAGAQLRTRFDVDQSAFWIRLQATPRPTLNEVMLRELMETYDMVARTGGTVSIEGRAYPLQYLVIASDTPGTFSLGGDHSFFLQMLDNNDFEKMDWYSTSCAGLVYRTYRALDLPLFTVTLVQGACMGGGAEAAIASDLLVAEESSVFGFPEITCNFFAGQGAASLLIRAVGRSKAEEMITTGRRYTAHEMCQIGLVDHVVPDGQGEIELDRLIRARQKTHAALLGFANARRIVERLELGELQAIARLWTECVMNMGERDRKMARRLIDRQNRL